MFLISNADMLIEAINSGITGCIPAHNYRTDSEFRMLSSDSQKALGPIGVNLIVKSNVKLKQQLNSCLELKVDYIILSWKPRKIINACKPLGIKVFCDVVDVKYALKFKV